MSRETLFFPRNRAVSSITSPRAKLRQPVFASLSRCYAQNRVFNYEPSMLSMLLHASRVQPGLRPARPHDKPIARNVERAAEPIANEQWWAGRARAVRGVHREFSWDALNVTKDTECGGTKCYFPSLQGEREGWLVGADKHFVGAAPPHPGDGSLTQWSRAWARAEELRAHFGVDHLLRGPPFLANLSREQATHLNAKMRSRLDRERNPYLKVWAQYYAAGPHPVQAVRSCSWPECMVLRCSESLADQAVDDFLANVPNKTKLGLGIKQSFALVAAMVKAHPCLKIDFQVYLRNDGAVLNIDLDRCDELTPGTREPLNTSHRGLHWHTGPRPLHLRRRSVPGCAASPPAACRARRREACRRSR